MRRSRTGTLRRRSTLTWRGSRWSRTTTTTLLPQRTMRRSLITVLARRAVVPRTTVMRTTARPRRRTRRRSHRVLASQRSQKDNFILLFLLVLEERIKPRLICRDTLLQCWQTTPRCSEGITDALDGFVVLGVVRVGDELEQLANPGVPERAGLEKREPVLLRKLEAFLFADLNAPFLTQVRFVRHNDAGQWPPWVLVANGGQPLGARKEGGSGADIIHNHSNRRILHVLGSEVAMMKYGLAGHVKKEQLNFAVRVLHRKLLDAEVNAECH
mmetsp:Transcript_3593/g.11092  ORF Transcript_3593/g.11092 Transcript_3593/m.11092 type:complete len:271 (-) Transcript_3593:499-1311(-)